MDWKEQMVNQLLDAIDIGYITEETIGKFSYAHLAMLREMTSKIENGKEFYLKIKSYLENINIQRLRRQEKITVGFIANYASTWIGNELYQLLEKSERFEPYVFLISNHNGQSEEMIKEEYKQNLKFFWEQNLRVVQTLDLDTGKQYTWEEIGIKPEVCIWLTPWIDLFREHFYLLNFSLDMICTYIPYGFMIAENENQNFVYHQYNQILHNVAWKNFEESRTAVEMARKYAYVGDNNAVYTGYPKMDMFYEEQNTQEDIWNKLTKCSGNPKTKRIIYAPHHTLDENEPVHFSTFADNYMLMLELAEKYQEETVWVFKPHPQLKYKAIKAGIFADISEWNEYEEKWKNLKNADIMEEGMYSEMFRKSDAMILDSVSFLAEYLYVGKPLLLLECNGQRFNDFGKLLVEIHYRAQGADKNVIEKFITEIVIGENDEKKEEREEFFKKNLDYMSIKGKGASANIYEELDKALR